LGRVRRERTARFERPAYRGPNLPPPVNSRETAADLCGCGPPAPDLEPNRCKSHGREAAGLATARFLRGARRGGRFPRALESGRRMFEIGSSLREARHRKGLDFPEVEQETKIRARYLRALEDEQFDILPSQTYVKGFLHSYAGFLGLDGHLYVDEYTSRFWIDDETGQRMARRVRVQRRNHRTLERNIIILTLVAIGVVTALVIAAWRFGSGDHASTSTPTRKAAKPARTAARPAAGSFVVRAATGGSLVEVHAGSPVGK